MHDFLFLGQALVEFEIQKEQFKFVPSVLREVKDPYLGLDDNLLGKWT